MVIAAFFLGTLVAPAALAFALRRTFAWWVAGVAVAGFGVHLLATLGQDEPPGDSGTGVWYGAGDFFQRVYGAAMLVYAVILLLASHAGRKARRAPEGAGRR